MTRSTSPLLLALLLVLVRTDFAEAGREAPSRGASVASGERGGGGPAATGTPPMARESHWIIRNRVPGECKGWGATTFVYARAGEFRMRLRVCDRIGNLRVLALEVNGVRVGMIDGRGLRSDGNPEGFDGSWGPWFDVRQAVRPGLNRISLFPVGRKLAPEVEGQQSEWTGEIRFGRCRRVDVWGTMQGWGDLASAGEQVYEVLAELDEACRRPECLPRRREYLKRRRWIRSRVASLTEKGTSQLFFGILNDFYHVTHHEKVDGVLWFRRWMEHYEQLLLRQEAIWATPFALFVYGRNDQGRQLSEFFRDLSLARAASRRAFEALLQLPPNVSGELVDACHRALDEERRRLRFLIDGTETVRMACRSEIERMREDFPFWKQDFRRAFAAYLRQQKVPHPDYPNHDDLVREMAILNDYFDVALSFARRDLDFTRYTHVAVDAMLSHSPRPVAGGGDPQRSFDRPVSADPPGDPRARRLPPPPRPRSHFPPARRFP